MPAFKDVDDLLTGPIVKAAEEAIVTAKAVAANFMIDVFFYLKK